MVANTPAANPVRVVRDASTPRRGNRTSVTTKVPVNSQW